MCATMTTVKPMSELYEHQWGPDGFCVRCQQGKVGGASCPVRPNLAVNDFAAIARRLKEIEAEQLKAKKADPSVAWTKPSLVDVEADEDTWWWRSW